jgi:hypothetical protein
MSINLSGGPVDPEDEVEMFGLIEKIAAALIGHDKSIILNALLNVTANVIGYGEDDAGFNERVKQARAAFPRMLDFIVAYRLSPKAPARSQ